MRFIFYSPVCFEKWDWRNSVEKGIGGSETSHVEMAWRLARKGHEVITYAPVPEDCTGEWKNTKWSPIENADFSQSGVWILYRCPDVIDKFDHSRTDQKLWLMMQDWDYPNWTDERIINTDKVITLCKSHGYDVAKKHPLTKKNLWLTSNGVKIDLIKEIEAEGLPERNPKKIIFASSPDRGLKHVVESFERAREFVPDLELHAFYGFNNLDKLTEANPKSSLRKVAEQTKELLQRPGVVWHGRTNQKELYREWLSAGMWVYQTMFNETSCITCMEAQAMGAIPIVNPIYALKENVKFGMMIPGDAWGDPLAKAKFAAEIVRWSNPELQETVRPTMMAVARERFDWENFVEQWECEALGTQYEKTFPEQIKFEIDYHSIKECRVCFSDKLLHVLSLGDLYVSDFTLKDVKNETAKFPLELILCENCKLVQLKDTVEPDKMYKFYYYHSSTNPSMRKALQDINEKTFAKIELKEDDVVVDIGCNDFYQLSIIDKKIIKVGFDPAKNILDDLGAPKYNNFIINDYFSYETYTKKIDKKAKVIFSIAMFYDLDRPNVFVEDIRKTLDKDGIWVVQMSYLPSMLSQNAFDNICHEHLEYYSLTSLKYLVEKRGLRIVDVELNDVNGGSFRVYIQHSDTKCSEEGLQRVQELLDKEKELNLDDFKIYAEFNQNVNVLRATLLNFLKEEKTKGKTIAVLGASTKGNTLLQYYGLTTEIIDFCAEMNEDKFDKLTVGSNIPIISQEEALKRNPDYFLVLPWHFIDNFKVQLKDYLDKGGKLITPLPKICLYQS